MRAVARLSQIFAPKDRVFFDLFEEAAANALRAAELLDEMLRSFPEHNDLARAILLCEQEGDRITYDMIQRLNATFVTPIDREDILELASGLDDIVDLTEEVADYLGLYHRGPDGAGPASGAHPHGVLSPDQRGRAADSRIQGRLALHGRDPPPRRPRATG